MPSDATAELEYSVFSTETLLALRRLFRGWPGQPVLARERLRMVERILEARAVNLADIDDADRGS